MAECWLLDAIRKYQSTFMMVADRFTASLEIAECYPQTRCLGGQDSACYSMQTGPYCSECVNGTYEMRFEYFLCSECYGQFYQLGIAYGVWIALIAIGILGLSDVNLIHLVCKSTLMLY